MMQNNKCPLCNTEGNTIYSVVKDYFVRQGNSPDFSIHFCPVCEVGYTTPPMSHKELLTYYPDNYESYVGKKSLAGFLQKIKYQSDLKQISNYHREKNISLFEIGTGRGEFLNEAKMYGFQVDGIEPGLAGRKFAYDNYGVKIQDGAAEDINFRQRYDAIALRHVLEHVENPYLCLENIFKNGLKEKGMLFLKLPRLDSGEARLFKKFWHGLDAPRHRIHFTKLGISKGLKRIGFSDVRVKSEIIPTDIMRSIEYFGYYGGKGSLFLFSAAARFFSKLPYQIKYVSCQFLGIVLAPFGTGRMIVFARKS